jgi:hypothetical protein
MEHDIKQNISRIYIPQSNALAERSMEDIRKDMRAFINDDKQKFFKFGE